METPLRTQFFLVPITMESSMTLKMSDIYDYFFELSSAVALSMDSKLK